MNLTPSAARALRRYYLRMWLYHLVLAAYHGACATFWRGVYTVLRGVAWLFGRKAER